MALVEMLKFNGPGQDQSWPRTLSILAIGLFVIATLFRADIASAVTVWANSSAYKFSFLILPISFYFIWIRRQMVAAMDLRPFPAGIWLGVPFGLLWIFSEAAQISVGKQLAVMGFIQVLLLTTLGAKVYRVLLFPFLYLWLMVPVGDFLVPILMDLTTFLTVGGVDLLGFEVRSEGYLIFVPHGSYVIVEACASFDFLIGSLSVSLVFGNLFYRAWRKRVACVFIALLAAVTANNIRTISVVAIMEMTEGASGLADSHLTFGWFVFFIVMVILMVIGWLLRDKIEEEPALLPEKKEMNGRISYARLALSVVLVTGLAGASKTFTISSIGDTAYPSQLTICVANENGAWTPSEDGSDWRPLVVESDGEYLGAFRKGGRQVDLFIAYFWRQRQGVEVVGEGIRLADRKTWFPLDLTHEDIRVAGKSLQAQAMRLRSEERRRAVWQVYWIDGIFTGGLLTAKLLGAKATLLGGELRAAYIAISSEEDGQPARARNAMQEFLDEGPSLELTLKGVRPRPVPCNNQSES